MPLRFQSLSARRMKRYLPLLVAVGIALLILSWYSNFISTARRKWSSDSVLTKRPHIIFILADDYGFNDVGFHGSEIRTPNLDRLAKEGVTLENYYVQPICSPTRSQLLSGRYNIHTGMQHNVIRPPQPFCHPLEDKTLAQALKDLGYYTHIVGKWHMGMYKKDCWPTHRGFDSFFGFLGGQEDHLTHHNDICGMDMQLPSCKSWDGLDLRDNDKVVNNYTGVYSTHLFTQRAQMVIENHDNHKPLFLYVSYQAVHKPLQVPEQYLRPYTNIQNEDRRLYAGMTTCMDQGVGNITRTLKKMGLWDDSVLIFSSDNGGQPSFGGNNWPLRGMKNTLWEGGIRAVAFVTSRLLDDQIKGTVYKGLLHVTDWFPSLLRGLNGASLMAMDLDGHDAWSAITTGVKSPRTEILHNIDPLIVAKSFKMKSQDFAELPSDSKFNSSIRAAIRVGDWKLLTGDPGDPRWVPSPEFPSARIPENTDLPGKHVWLFNIADDPNETNDMSEEQPDIVRKLYQKLRDYNSEAVPPMWPDPDWRADPALHNKAWDNWQ